MGKKVRWMGPWEEIREDSKKFKKYCVLDTIREDDLLNKFDSTIPEKVVLWSFVTNPRGILFPIEEDTFGFQNTAYITWWQQRAQELWQIFSSKFNEIIPIVSLHEAAEAGLYEDDALPEQFPGGSEGVGQHFIDYPVGDFEKRNYGGWKWFGLIVEGDQWEQRWEQHRKPKMSSKEKLKHEAAPKYYKPWKFSGNKLKESDGKALYAKPHGVHFISRRYHFPWIIGKDEESYTAQRYENVEKIITETLETPWTLAVWNAIECEYEESKKYTSLILRPEITLSIGRFSDETDGEKRWGKSFEHLHCHWEKLYWVKVGLPKKAQIELKTKIKKEDSPIWDGTYEKVWDLLKEPYSLLLELAVKKLKKLLK